MAAATTGQKTTSRTGSAIRPALGRSRKFNGKAGSNRWRRATRQMTKCRYLNKKPARLLRTRQQPPNNDRQNQFRCHRRDAVGEQRDRARMPGIVRIAMKVLMRIRHDLEHAEQKHHDHKKRRTSSLERHGVTLDDGGKAIHGFKQSVISKSSRGALRQTSEFLEWSAQYLTSSLAQRTRPGSLTRVVCAKPATALPARLMCSAYFLSNTLSTPAETR